VVGAPLQSSDGSVDGVVLHEGANLHQLLSSLDNVAFLVHLHSGETAENVIIVRIHASQHQSRSLSKELFELLSCHDVLRIVLADHLRVISDSLFFRLRFALKSHLKLV